MGRLSFAVVLTICCILAWFKSSEGTDAKSRRHLSTKHHRSQNENLPFPRFTHQLHHHQRRRNRQQDELNYSVHPVDRNHRLLRSETKLIPLFPGYGTHYVYLYVGTPPQRQSVIVDTGSFITAFPCSECSQCGQHTDPYFDVKNSSTAVIPKCLQNANCAISQTYTEGSTWHGYKVTDKVWLGDSEIGLVPRELNFKTDFTFACQTQVTGLFRSQLADGIMGMSDSEETLPYQMMKHNVTESKIFSLCLRIGGGIFTVGGVDTRIHIRKTQYVRYSRLLGGVYGVTLKSISFVALTGKTSGNGGANITLPETEAKFAQTKGVVIDSGATDTYLPAAVAASFTQSFKKMTGINFASGSIELSEAQINALPDIVFSLVGLKDDEIVQVSMPAASYIDDMGNGKYAFRIFLTEKTGTILGSNFMLGHNIIFDPDNKRVGIAKSKCNYEEFQPKITAKPTLKPTSLDGNQGGCDVNKLIPYTPCTAYCSRNETGYYATGTQDWIKPCVKEDNIVTRDCSENCSYHRSVRGSVFCPDKPWTECTHGCVMSRMAVPKGEPLVLDGGKCNYKVQTATCYTGLCPRQDGDYLVYIDMRVRIDPRRWSYVYTEAFFKAFIAIFKLKGNSIEILNNAGNELASSSKLHFQIRLKAKDYTGTIALHTAAEKIVTFLRGADFAKRMIDTLNEVSDEYDGSQMSRFGWLFPNDVEVLSALAIPIGEARDPDGESADDDKNEVNYPALNTFALFILGIAMAAVVILFIVLYLHCRLRKEFAMMSKDKSNLKKSTETLKKLWNKFAGMASTVTGAADGAPLKPGTKEYLDATKELSKLQSQREVELAQQGLLSHIGAEDDDDEDYEDLVLK